PVAAPCLCLLLSHQTLLWHHRLGHPSLPCLCGMHSRLLVSGIPRSLPPLPPSPAPPCLPCVEGQQRAAPHSSSFPPTTAPMQTLHMDVQGLALGSPRVAPYCSPRVALYCHVHRALLPCLPRPLPCSPRRALPCPAAPPSPAEPRRPARAALPNPSHAALPRSPTPPSRPAATSAAAQATAGAGGGAAGSAGSAAGAGGAGPTTDRHCLSWPLSRQLQQLGVDSGGHCLSRTTPPLRSFASGFFSEPVQVVEALVFCVLHRGSSRAAALGASESAAALGASESFAALGASESAAAPGASESKQL
ncbi:unnamed protein product, partial [Closterium sp. NIES-54]